MLSTDECWLMGALAGDSGAYTAKVSLFGGLDDDFVREACRIMLEVWPDSRAVVHHVPPRPGLNKHGVPFQWTWVLRSYGRIMHPRLTAIGPLGRSRWRVPLEIASGSSEQQRAWLSGFADAEGSVIYIPETSERKIEYTSTNEEGLVQASEMLKGAGVDHRFVSRPVRNPRHKPSYQLMITHRENLVAFESAIGFRVASKRQKLRSALERYVNFPKRSSYARKPIAHHKDEILKLKAAGFSYTDIAERLGIEGGANAIALLLQRLKKKGEVHVARGTKQKEAGKEILRLRAEGKTFKEIDGLLGLVPPDYRHAPRSIIILQALKRGGHIAEDDIPHKKTKRESLNDILRLKSEGKTFKEIDGILGLAPPEYKGTPKSIGVITWARRNGKAQ